ncbi:acetate--CoA ligase [Nocardia farcinica]|nr:acetate--CoA ligase [Nocardia farcinica]
MTDSTTYAAAYRDSLDDPSGFWGRAAEDIEWVKRPSVVLDDSNAPFYRWFPDGILNTCNNALDRHVRAGRGEQTALVHVSPITGSSTSITYSELLDRVATFAGVLADLGVGRGDRVIIYMPMIPEAVVAMLACARRGAIHSVVFGGFAAPELAARIDDASPKVVVTASCGLEPRRVIEYKPLLDAAIQQSQHNPAVVVKQRPQVRATLVEGRDHDWDDAVAHTRAVECTDVLATDPLYILYTSGTTGQPKGIVRDNGGHAVAMTWSLRNIFGLRSGDVWWAASDVGWVVGHSYIVYAPLLCGATTVLFEGKPVGTPDAATFWRVIEEHRVTQLFTAPTAIRAIRQADPDAVGLTQHDTSTLRTLFLAGERLDADTYAWASRSLGVPVVDNWWQTETGWPIVANPVGLGPHPIKPGSPSLPMPGYDVRVLRPDGTTASPSEEGAICVRLPLPPGSFTTVWRDDDRYVRSYLSTFPGNYSSGDSGFVDDEGYVFVMGRTDDVINVAGHRLSPGSIESAIAGHRSVAECAVIGVFDPIKGQVPRALVVLDAHAQVDPDQLHAELELLVRRAVGAIAVPARTDLVEALPKTRSGKILRRTMRDLADGRDTPNPATVDDTAVLDSLRTLLSKH